LTGNKARARETFVLVFGDWSVNLIARAVGYGQIVLNTPLVLGVNVMLVGFGDNDLPRALVVASWDAQEEVQTRITSRVFGTVREREGAVVPGTKRIPDLESPTVIAKL